MKLPDLEAWAIFAKVAEHQSFTSAADALGASKATISKAISRLEAQIQTPLFHRSSRRLALTESGVSLLEYAQAILNRGELAEEKASEESGALSGIVRVAAPMSYGVSRVAPLISQFLSDHPDIVIDLHLEDARVNIIEQRFDLALRITSLPDSSLRARKIRDVKRYVLASPNYLARKGYPRHPAQLGEHSVICYSLLATRETWRFRSDEGEEAALTPTGPFRVNNGEAMLSALRAGLGIGLLPDFLAEDDLESGTLVPILEGWSMQPVSLYLVSPPGTIRPRRVEALMTYLAENIAARRQPIS